jgi:hypothetical protein
MLVMVLVFGMSVVGCMSVQPNYYNLGDVSEDNCALIRILPFTLDSDSSSKYGWNSLLVRIDGQSSRDHQWKINRVPFMSTFMGEGDAIVSVTPDRHTFTFYFIYERKDIPVSITYDCKPGHGYTFSVSVKEVASVTLLPALEAKITIYELIPDENGNFGGLGSKSGNLGGFGSNMRVADRHTETFLQEVLKMQ